MGPKQIRDTVAATGVRLSCRDVKARVNAMLEEAGCCFRVVCKPAEKTYKGRDIEPGVSIDPVFE
jgi:hypothetical protein